MALREIVRRKIRKGKEARYREEGARGLVGLATAKRFSSKASFGIFYKKGGYAEVRRKFFLQC